MSLLNNKDNTVTLTESETTDTKPKIKTVTKVIIFLIFFTIIAISITVGAILFTNITNGSNKTSVENTKPILNNKTVVSQPVKVVSDGLGIKNLTEQYNENDLKITEIENEPTSTEQNSSWAEIEKSQKLSIQYIEIDGLKNTAIEEQINNEIKEFAYSLYSEEEFNNQEIDRISISSYCTANFGNVLSVHVSKSVIYKNKDIDSLYTNFGLNYDLTTGSKLKFTDLFTNSSIRNSLIKSIYTDLVEDYAYAAMAKIETPSIDMSNVDLSTIEEETYITVNNILNNLDNLNFNFSPSYIQIYQDGKYNVSIDMKLIYEKIAIYNRFKTEETIFAGTYSGHKNIFILATRDYDIGDAPYTYYEDVYDNLRIEAVVDKSFYNEKNIINETDIKPLVDSCILQIEDKISDIKNIAKKNPDKAYIYTAYYNISSNSDYNLNNLNIDNLIISASGVDTIYSMSKDYYTNTYYAKIGDFYRKDMPYIRYVFEHYDADDNNSVEIQSFTSNIAEYDYYTKKTPDELLQDFRSEIPIYDDYIQNTPGI